ncbi:MAG: hypothetical protein JNL42_01850 [Anaerolineae bacterium]|nr:hypothetical protein [Anaerolineae bacterium]
MSKNIAGLFINCFEFGIVGKINEWQREARRILTDQDAARVEQQWCVSTTCLLPRHGIAAPD